MNTWSLHYEPSDAAINFQPASVGDNTLITADPTKVQNILAFSAKVDGATTITVKCGTRTVGVFKLSAGDSLNSSGLANHQGEPYFICRQGEAFIWNSSAAVAITGTIKYAWVF